jgi:hypothetical protein
MRYVGGVGRVDFEVMAGWLPGFSFYLSSSLALIQLLVRR